MFAGIINNDGRLVDSAIRGKAQFYVDGMDKDVLFIEVALRTKMMREFDESLSSMNFSVCVRNTITTMEFPFNNFILFISAEKIINLNEISTSVLEILKNQHILYS